MLKPFPSPIFSYPLETSENSKIFSSFHGVEKRCVGSKWVKMITFTRIKP